MHTVITPKIGYSLVYINVREYRRGNQERTIQRNWQHRVHKTKKNKTKTQTQNNMRWAPLCANKHKKHIRMERHVYMCTCC